MLLGISQKHNMCSSPYRLTEICNSQCLSHFAAPFIVARTETFIAENCKLPNKYIKKMRHKFACKKINDGSGQVCNTSCPAQRPLVSAKDTRLSISKQTIQIVGRIVLIHVRMILPQVHLRKPCYDFSFL